MNKNNILSKPSEIDMELFSLIKAEDLLVQSEVERVNSFIKENESEINFLVTNEEGKDFLTEFMFYSDTDCDILESVDLFLKNGAFVSDGTIRSFSFHHGGEEYLSKIYDKLLSKRSDIDKQLASILIDVNDNKEESRDKFLKALDLLALGANPNIVNIDTQSTVFYHVMDTKDTELIDRFDEFMDKKDIEYYKKVRADMESGDSGSSFGM